MNFRISTLCSKYEKTKFAHEKMDCTQKLNRGRSDAVNFPSRGEKIPFSVRVRQRHHLVCSAACSRFSHCSPGLRLFLLQQGESTELLGNATVRLAERQRLNERQRVHLLLASVVKDEASLSDSQHLSNQRHGNNVIISARCRSLEGLMLWCKRPCGAWGWR